MNARCVAFTSNVQLPVFLRSEVAVPESLLSRSFMRCKPCCLFLGPRPINRPRSSKCLEILEPRNAGCSAPESMVLLAAPAFDWPLPDLSSLGSSKCRRIRASSSSRLQQHIIGFGAFCDIVLRRLRRLNGRKVVFKKAPRPLFRRFVIGIFVLKLRPERRGWMTCENRDCGFKLSNLPHGYLTFTRSQIA
jgi:hypothetical protein